jgi:hypothetical protein
MKTIAPKILEANGITGVEVTPYVNEGMINAKRI